MSSNSSAQNTSAFPVKIIELHRKRNYPNRPELTHADVALLMMCENVINSGEVERDQQLAEAVDEQLAQLVQRHPELLRSRWFWKTKADDLKNTRTAQVSEAYRNEH